MSRTDHHNSPARYLRTDAEIRNGVVTFVPKRPTVDAGTDIAERLDASVPTPEWERELLRQAKIERARETARALIERDRNRVAKPVAKPVTRVQMFAPTDQRMRSVGRVHHVGKHQQGRHIADMGAGQPQSLMAMAKRRSA